MHAQRLAFGLHAAEGNFRLGDFAAGLVPVHDGGFVAPHPEPGHHELMRARAAEAAHRGLALPKGRGPEGKAQRVSVDLPGHETGRARGLPRDAMALPREREEVAEASEAEAGEGDERHGAVILDLHFPHEKNASKLLDQDFSKATVLQINKLRRSDPELGALRQAIWPPMALLNAWAGLI